jgi:Arc/MetJ family transcription regulator
MSRIRTNIRLQQDKLDIIMRRYGLRTKSEAVDLALTHLAGQPMTRAEALAMKGQHAIEQIPPDSGPAALDSG